ncbi:MAG: trigger factor, partial [Acidimicrobiia bacterium]
MKSTVETLEGNKVKLFIEVEASEIDQQVDEAFKRLAKQVRLPGFRPGKAPRKVLEARLGLGVARQDALRESLPEYYAEAVKNHEVDAIAAPQLEITSGTEEGPVAFEAVVETRPLLDLDGYQSLQVTVPSPAVDDAEIEARIERLRTQHAEHEPVERAAEDGDQVLIDIAGAQGGEPVEGLTATDYLYEVGSGGVVAEIDENLRGAVAGATLDFDAAHPEEGEEDLHFTIEVQEVRGRILPELTDEWVAEVTEFSSVDAMRDAYRDQESRRKVVAANMAMQQKTAEALMELVTDEVPQALVTNELSARLNNLDNRMRSQGMDLNRYLQLTGQSAEDLVAEYRSASEQAVKVDLALRAVAEREGFEVVEEDLEKHFAELSRRFGAEAEEIRQNFERAGQMLAVRSDIKKTKALEWLLERVSLVDEDGNPIDLSSLYLS